MHNYKDLIKRIAYTFFILLIYIIGTNLTVPGFAKINTENVTTAGMMTVLSGGTFKQFSIFALGVGPYITASMITGILSMMMFKPLSDLSENGDTGRKKIEKINRFLCIFICLIQGYFNIKTLSDNYNFVIEPSFISFLYIDIVFTAGTLALLWLGDRITLKGLGNGISLIIFTNIATSIPKTFKSAYEYFLNQQSSSLNFVLYIICYILIICAVIFVKNSERRIPILQSQRSIYNMKAAESYLPLKLNSSEITPVIFASSVLQIPLNISSWIGKDAHEKVSYFMRYENPWFLIIYSGIIFIITIFFTKMQINPKRIATTMSEEGQYIPSIRPGFETQKYISQVLTRITYVGAILLALLSILPYLTILIFKLPSTLALGGTGIVILVGVAVETVNELLIKIGKKANWSVK